MSDPMNVPRDVRQWEFYPIVMPLTKDGNGPASAGEIDRLAWEVWDRCHQSYASHDNLPDAINDCLYRNALAAAPKVEQEPVGYADPRVLAGMKSGRYADVTIYPTCGTASNTALYTHPAPSRDELLEAATEMREVIRSLNIKIGGQDYEGAERWDAIIAKHKEPQL